MAKPLLKDSLLLRMGLILAGIVLLALVSMLSSVIIAEAARGDAAAINLAGSLRMQSYRIATRLLSAAGDPTAGLAPQVDAEIREFERRLGNPLLTAVIPAAGHDPRRLSYERIRQIWQDRLKPFLAGRDPDGRIGLAVSAFGEPRSNGPLNQIDLFVLELDRLVGLLEQRAEAKIHWLRLIQGAVLGFTAILVMVALAQIQRRVLAPLRELMEQARRAQGGDFSARTHHVGEDELGLLGRTFNGMAADLSQMYADLEAQVNEQTRALRISNRSLELLYRAARRLTEAPPEPTLLKELVTEAEKLIGAACHLSLDPLVDAGSERPEPSPPAATLLIPVQDRGQRFGVLRVYAEGGPLTGWRRDLLETLARHIAVALRARRQRERDRRLVLLEERSVIARELHDSLAQALSYLKIQVTRLQSGLNGGAPDHVTREVIGELREGLNNAYRQLRELLKTFRLKMDGLGLEPGLDATAREFAERGGLDIRLDYGLPDNLLGPNEEIHVLQIVREALSNVVHHARARRVELTLHQLDDGRVRVRVEDDGIGIGDNPERENHYGLGIMRERARSLAGALCFENRSGGGTRVELSFHPAPAHAGPSPEDSAQHALS